MQSKFLTSLWFSWVSLTAIYLVTYDLSFGPLLGLFVPYGWWNGSALFFALMNANLIPFIGLALLIGVLVFADRIARYMDITSPGLKILYNLLVLFVMTFLVDLSIWGTWQSWAIFINPESIQ